MSDRRRPLPVKHRDINRARREGIVTRLETDGVEIIIRPLDASGAAETNVFELEAERLRQQKKQGAS